MRFFRALMPKEEGFVDNFVSHARLFVEAADALAALMTATPDARAEWQKKVTTLESDADVIARKTIIGLHRAFITPFDRSDIHALTNALDDAIDLIEDVVLRANLYKVTDFDPHMRRLTGMIQEAAKLVAEVTPLLTNITGNAEKIRALCERVSKIEGDADEALLQALSELIEQRPDTITFFGRKEVYELLEAITDCCDQVADVIEGIVLDHV